MHSDRKSAFDRRQDYGLSILESSQNIFESLSGGGIDERHYLIRRGRYATCEGENPQNLAPRLRSIGEV